MMAQELPLSARKHCNKQATPTEQQELLGLAIVIIHDEVKLGAALARLRWCGLVLSSDISSSAAVVDGAPTDRRATKLF
jgi:hypothetical protein